MARTHIYLTDRLIENAEWNRRDIILRQAAGMWKKPHRSSRFQSYTIRMGPAQAMF